MVERRLGGDSLEFPAPQRSPLCGIKRATRSVREPVQVTERGDEEVYRVLSEWTWKVCPLGNMGEHNLDRIYLYVTHGVIYWFQKSMHYQA